MNATGQGMLLWQGAIAFEHWFGQPADVASMRQGLGLQSQTQYGLAKRVRVRYNAHKYECNDS